jgi:O-antigen ligase
MGLMLLLLVTIGATFHSAIGPIAIGLFFLSCVYLLINVRNYKFNNKEMLYIGAAIAFPLLVAINIFFSSEPEWKHLDNPSRFLLVIPIFLAIRYSTVSVDYFNWGIFFAALLAGVIALYQRHWLGIDRVYGFISLINSPIIFGNIGLLLGVLAPTTYPTIKKSLGRWALVCVTLTTLAGLNVSLLSGTRGGWIAVPFLLVLIGSLMPKGGKIKSLLIILVLAGVFVALYYVDQQVRNRIDAAYFELYKILVSGEVSNGSVGLRFQLWHVAWLEFLQHPLTGVGLGQYFNVKLLLVKAGIAGSVVQNFQFSHNEPMHILAEMGLLGFISLMMMHLSSLLLCLHYKKEKFTLAIAGMLIVFTRFDISLSQVQLAYHTTTLFYCILFAIVAGFMCRSAAPNNEPQLRPKGV